MRRNCCLLNFHSLLILSQIRIIFLFPYSSINIKSKNDVIYIWACAIFDFRAFLGTRNQVSVYLPLRCRWNALEIIFSLFSPSLQRTVHHSNRTTLKHLFSMSGEKKLAKRLKKYKQFDEATIIAAVTTATMGYRDLKATIESMEHLYKTCKEIDEISMENEHTKTISPPKWTKKQVLILFLDQFSKNLAKYEFHQDLDRF